MATQFLYDLTDTWNSGVTDFRAFKMSVTDAASGAGSKLMEFEVNGNSRFSLDKLGNLTVSGELLLGTALPVESGGTGGTTPAEALEAIGAVGKTAVDEGLAARVKKAGDRMTGALSSAVKDHGSLGAVNEEYKFADANTHKVTIAATSGTHMINPTGLAEGDVMQVNILYQSGALAVAGTTQWELGGGTKSANIADVGVVLTVGAAYRMVFEVVGGIRTAVFQ